MITKPSGLVPVPAVRADKFHTAHKLTLMAHGPKHYTEIGRLVADASDSLIRCPFLLSGATKVAETVSLP